MSTEQPEPLATGDPTFDEDLIDYSEHEEDYISPVKSRFPSPSKLKAERVVVATTEPNNVASAETASETFDFEFEDVVLPVDNGVPVEILTAQPSLITPVIVEPAAAGDGQNELVGTDDAFKIDYEDAEDTYSAIAGDEAPQNGVSQQSELVPAAEPLEVESAVQWDAGSGYSQAPRSLGDDDIVAQDALGVDNDVPTNTQSALGDDGVAIPQAFDGDGGATHEGDVANPEAFESDDSASSHTASGQEHESLQADQDGLGYDGAGVSVPEDEITYDDEDVCDFEQDNIHDSGNNLDDALNTIMENARAKNASSPDDEEKSFEAVWPEIMVAYKGEDYPMFAHQGLSFFDSVSVLDEHIDSLLSGMRECIVGEIDADDELILEIPDFGLRFSQSMDQKHLNSTTLQELIDIHKTLLANSEGDLPDVLYTILTIHPRPLARLRYLREAAEAGSSLQDVVKSAAEYSRESSGPFDPADVDSAGGEDVEMSDELEGEGDDEGDDEGEGEEDEVEGEEDEGDGEDGGDDGGDSQGDDGQEEYNVQDEYQPQEDIHGQDQDGGQDESPADTYQDEEVQEETQGEEAYQEAREDGSEEGRSDAQDENEEAYEEGRSEAQNEDAHHEDSHGEFADEEAPNEAQDENTQDEEYAHNEAPFYGEELADQAEQNEDEDGQNYGDQQTPNPGAGFDEGGEDNGEEFVNQNYEHEMSVGAGDDDDYVAEGETGNELDAGDYGEHEEAAGDHVDSNSAHDTNAAQQNNLEAIDWANELSDMDKQQNGDDHQSTTITLNGEALDAPEQEHQSSFEYDENEIDWREEGDPVDDAPLDEVKSRSPSGATKRFRAEDEELDLEDGQDAKRRRP